MNNSRLGCLHRIAILCTVACRTIKHEQRHACWADFESAGRPQAPWCNIRFYLRYSLTHTHPAVLTCTSGCNSTHSLLSTFCTNSKSIERYTLQMFNQRLSLNSHIVCRRVASSRLCCCLPCCLCSCRPHSSGGEGLCRPEVRLHHCWWRNCWLCACQSADS